MPRALDGHKWFYYFCPEEEALAGMGTHSRHGAASPLAAWVSAAGVQDCEGLSHGVSWSWGGGIVLPTEATGLRSRPSLTDAAFGWSAAPGRWC